MGSCKITRSLIQGRTDLSGTISSHFLPLAALESSEGVRVHSMYTAMFKRVYNESQAIQLMHALMLSVDVLMLIHETYSKLNSYNISTFNTSALL